MSVVNKLLFKLTGGLRCRIITVSGKPYLERYFITKNIFIHRFISGDGDRHIHDHPWAWAFSLILLGGYVEELKLGPLVKRRWFNYIGPYYFHRIVNVRPKTWTLFIHGEKVKPWGFIDSDGAYNEANHGVLPVPYKLYPLGCYAWRQPL